MKIVQVFKTDVKCSKEASRVTALFLALYPAFKINVDLEDEDNILRIESYGIEIEIHYVVNLMKALGYYCERLE